MANEIDNAVKVAEKALPSSLTWLDAFKSHGAATVLPIWEITGTVAANDKLSSVDRLRLAGAIVKQQTSKEEDIVTSTNEAGDALALANSADREFILAAASHRRQLQQSDTESVFAIAARLKKAVETKRAADAAQQRRPEPEVFDANAHRPGFRDGTQWRHDRRKKRTTEEFDPEGRQQATYVSTSEEEDYPEKSLSDARNAYLDYVQNAYKRGK
jgi:hypothetical protein